MSKKAIITISRQFGSGGREIGKKLAEKMQIPFYDKELIELAAKESGIDPELFEGNDEKTSIGFQFLNSIGFTLGSPITSISEMSLSDRMFLIQTEIIEKLADNGPCVIVGRCADYILAQRSDVLNVFIHGDIRDRVERAKTDYKVDERDIEGSIMKIDKRRASYYNYYTNGKWGKADNYDLSINSSTFGIDCSVDIIEKVLK